MADPSGGEATQPANNMGFLPFKIEPTQLLAAVGGYLYVAGYLINAITLRNYGIQRFEAVKLQYVEVGLSFTVLSLMLTVIPTAALLVHFRVRRKAQLPNYRVGALGYLLNTCNLFGLLIVFAVFMTSYEWTVPIRGSQRWTVGQLFYIYSTLSVFSLVLLPIVERLIVKWGWRVKSLYCWCVEPVRYLIVLLGLAFDTLLILTIPWLGDLVGQGAPYCLSVWFLYAGCGAVIYWLRKVGAQGVSPLLLTLGTTGMLAVFYVCINAYVFGVVRTIPINRGGKLPVTLSYLVSDNAVLGNLPIKSERREGASMWGPVYVLEENPDFFYVVDKEHVTNWIAEWMPVVAVRKDLVHFVLHKRIRDGHPRTRQVQTDTR